MDRVTPIGPTAAYAIVLLLAVGAPARATPDAGAATPPAAPAPKADAKTEQTAPVHKKGDLDQNAIPVPPPPFSEDIFPCTECHEDGDEVDYERRAFTEEHSDIKLHHGDRERWCFDCHNPEKRDFLRLASGKLVTFEKSYLLCGQCHGPKLRDWRAGVHGKRTGMWNGKKRYRLCVHCHVPHSPAFKPLVPRPRPQRPDEIGHVAPKVVKPLTPDDMRPSGD